ncbi:ankyrin repeat family protein [Striga asiatica]|uniref:Ankyrin repeat family protein n=1 Tax=Striga asiatica TaxID=4170 RepID=A0A5A7NWP1_STRAF|nr:ankyrin repeat family protein [Striga asiatica]
MFLVKCTVILGTQSNQTQGPVHGSGVRRYLSFQQLLKASSLRNENGRSVIHVAISSSQPEAQSITYLLGAVEFQPFELSIPFICEFMLLCVMVSSILQFREALWLVDLSCDREGWVPLHSACGCYHNFHKKEPDCETHPTTASSDSSVKKRLNFDSQQSSLPTSSTPLTQVSYSKFAGVTIESWLETGTVTAGSTVYNSLTSVALEVAISELPEMQLVYKYVLKNDVLQFFFPK